VPKRQHIRYKFGAMVAYTDVFFRIVAKNVSCSTSIVMYMRILAITIILALCPYFLIIGCASPSSAAKSETKDKSSVTEQPVDSTLLRNLRKDSVKTMTFSTVMNVVYNDFNQTANARVRVAGRDSLAMEITAFGIPVAKLFMSKDKFVFLDLFNGKVIEGKSSAANMARVTNIPLSFDDFVCLLRCEAPFPADKYSNEGKTSSGSIVLKYDRPDNNREFIALDEKDKLMKQYQRKDNEGTLLMNINYAENENLGSESFPKKVQLQAPLSKFKLSVESKDIQINTVFTESFRFKIPQGIEKQIMD